MTARSAAAQIFRNQIFTEPNDAVAGQAAASTQRRDGEGRREILPFNMADGAAEEPDAAVNFQNVLVADALMKAIDVLVPKVMKSGARTLRWWRGRRWLEQRR